MFNISNDQFPMTKTNAAGFTLVELLVVLAIIGIISSLVTVNVVTVRAKARDNQRQADLAALAVALENYRSEQKAYPEQSTGLTDASVALSALMPRYIDTLPKDPTRATAATVGYQYATNSINVTEDSGIESRRAGSLFVLDARLEREVAASELVATIEPINNSLRTSQKNFFKSGFYRDATGDYHYRLSR